MAFNYYQHNPGWGTSQFQPGPPPVPSFQPEPVWNGWDFYRAHAINPNPSLFYSTLDRVRGLDPARYVSTHAARSIHHRVYGGLLSLAQILPSELGSAAAYEAYRTWRHHNRMLQPLGGDYTREAEALVGLALAEASHLWQYSGRPMDTHGLRDALESAALTATRLYDDRRDNIMRDASRVSTVGGGGVPRAIPPPSPIYARDYPQSRRQQPSLPSVIRIGSPSAYLGRGGSIPPGPAATTATFVGTPLPGIGPSILGSSPMNMPLPPAGGIATTIPAPGFLPGGGGGGLGYAPTAGTAPVVAPPPIIIPPPQPQPAVTTTYPTGYTGYAGGQSQRPIVIQQSPSSGYSNTYDRHDGYRGGGYYDGGHNPGYPGGYHPSKLLGVVQRDTITVTAIIAAIIGRTVRIRAMVIVGVRVGVDRLLLKLLSGAARGDIIIVTDIVIIIKGRVRSRGA